MSRIRIVGGAWRSRLLNVTDALGLRPTPDRVRETLYNWLGQDLTDWRCLDLFAGSGILGFEAASRGASHVTLVEKNPKVAAELKLSVKTLQAAQVEVIRADAVEFARTSPHAFDLVLLDPPYAQGWLDKIEPHLPRLVRPGGWVYAEAEAPLTHLGAWQTVKSGRAGQVYYHLMQGQSE